MHISIFMFGFYVGLINLCNGFDFPLVFLSLKGYNEIKWMLTKQNLINKKKITNLIIGFKKTQTKKKG